MSDIARRVPGHVDHGGPVNCEKNFGSGSKRRVGGHFLFPNRTLVGFGLSERVAQRRELRSSRSSFSSLSPDFSSSFPRLAGRCWQHGYHICNIETYGLMVSGIPRPPRKKKNGVRICVLSMLS